MGDPIAASREDPVLPGITLVSSRNSAGSDIWDFTINPGEEDVALESLFAALDDTTRFSLSDHSRGDNESTGFYQLEDGKIAYQLGGHGWSADQVLLDRESALAIARNQVQYNLGPPKSDYGHFTREIIGYQPPVHADPQFGPFLTFLARVLAKLFP